MTPRRSAAALAVLVAVGVVAGVRTARAQGRGEEGAARRMYVGAVAGPLFDAAPQFSEDPCDPTERTFFYGARAGFAFRSFLVVEGGLSIHQESDGRFCAVDPAPPPENGSWTRRVYKDGTVGYPFGSDEIRVIVQMPERPGRPSARLVAGAGWLWSKDVGLVLAGGGLRYGGERLAATIDLERWWFDVPFIDVEETFVDGQLVSQQQTGGEDSETPTVVRVGVNYRL